MSSGCLPAEERVWPNPTVEKEMLADVKMVEADPTDPTFARDCACHVRALLCRVRELEKHLPWLLRCEAAMKSMANQMVSPKTTAEEMVDMVLGEKHEGPRKPAR